MASETMHRTTTPKRALAAVVVAVAVAVTIVLIVIGAPIFVLIPVLALSALGTYLLLRA